MSSSDLKATIAGTLAEAETAPMSVTVVGGGKAPSTVLDANKSQAIPEPVAEAASTATNTAADEPQQSILTVPLEPRQAVPPAPIAPAATKMTVMLDVSTFARLERLHDEARAQGIKLRRGANPSLFFAAALEALDELEPSDRTARIAQLAARL